MFWAFAVVAVAILYLAVRYKKFQSWVEPVLTIAVALGLAVALLLWFTENRSVAPVPAPPADTIAPEEIELSDLQFAPGQPATSYRVTGTITNKSAVALQSFRLDITLADCPGEPCRSLGTDSALIIARVPPGQTQPFTTFAVFTGGDLVPVKAPRWSWSISDVRPLAR